MSANVRISHYEIDEEINRLQFGVSGTPHPSVAWFLIDQFNDFGLDLSYALLIGFSILRITYTSSVEIEGAESTGSETFFYRGYV